MRSSTLFLCTELALKDITALLNRFDLEDTAFSPPNQDDCFFYMRYPRHTAATEKLNTATESIVPTEKVKIIDCNTGNDRGDLPYTRRRCIFFLRFSFFISDNKKAANMTDVVINKENTHLSKTAKSFGGDDMFRGDHAGYGHSIVQVSFSGSFR